MSRRLPLALFALASVAVLAACATSSKRNSVPLVLVPQVDLARFMGDWYVIAAIPTVFERNAYDPVENYRLDPDGSIATTFSFSDGGFDGARKHYRSRGFVVAGSGNAVWGQQYLWPFEADYRISYLSSDYSQVVVTREKRDHVWIMARTPQIGEADLARLTAFVAEQGYDVAQLRRMPQAGVATPGATR